MLPEVRDLVQYAQPLASAPPTLVQYRPGIGRWAQQAALCAARARQDPSRTRQSLLTLATFRSWGIRWMTPHEGPSERLPDPVPGCEPAPNRFHPPLPELEDALWA